MYRPTGSWNVGRPEVTYKMYKENMQLNRPQQTHVQGNTQHNYDFQHWCETCDKGFTTAHFLENHKLQHQKCNIDGCQFIAHPKIITKHIQMQHSTGLFTKIAKLNNPDDIRKWRDERKRKYPTIENIKKKEAENTEKINRGERMGMKYAKSKKNDKPDFQHRTNQRLPQIHRSNHSQGKHNQININRKRIATDATKKSYLPKKTCKVDPHIEDSKTLKPFGGIQSLQIENDDLDEQPESENQYCVPIDDDEDRHIVSDTVQKESTVLEPAVCSAITSLMNCYASSDEDEVETNSHSTEIKKPLNKSKAEEIRNNDNSSIQNQPKNNHDAEKTCENIKVQVPICQGAADDESGPEEVKISKEGTTLPVDNTNKTPKIKLTKELSKKLIGPSTKKYEFKKRNKIPSTLLEKLLHREIQHERNVILQCVRYVVKNKYFEKG